MVVSLQSWILKFIESHSSSPQFVPFPVLVCLCAFKSECGNNKEDVVLSQSCCNTVKQHPNLEMRQAEDHVHVTLNQVSHFLHIEIYIFKVIFNNYIKYFLVSEF